MKNELIQKNIRDYVQDTICRNLYLDKMVTLKWILKRFEEYDKNLSLDHLIELSADYSHLLPQNPYTANTKQLYKDLGLEGIMTYRQFIFELPKIWYTTLFRLIQEWSTECSEGELAY